MFGVVRTLHVPQTFLVSLDLKDINFSFQIQVYHPYLYDGWVIIVKVH